MTDKATPPAGAVAVPGPSLRTEGTIRQTIDQIRDAIAGLQGAANAVRSLGR